LKVFVFVKTVSGKEVEVAAGLKALSNLNRVYLILGESELLAEFDNDSKGLTSLKEIAEIVFSGVRRLEHVMDAKTIIPVEFVSRENHGGADAFVLLGTHPGRAREILRRLNELPEVFDARLVFEDELFVHFRLDDIRISSCQSISDMGGEKIAAVKWVSNMETVMPFLLSDHQSIHGFSDSPVGCELSA
jgi:hypothetical protein